MSETSRKLESKAAITDRRQAVVAGEEGCEGKRVEKGNDRHSGDRMKGKGMTES